MKSFHAFVKELLVRREKTKRLRAMTQEHAERSAHDCAETRTTKGYDNMFMSSS